MKKTYITPNVIVAKMDFTVMAATSMNVNSGASSYSVDDAKAGEGSSTWDDED